MNMHCYGSAMLWCCSAIVLQCCGSAILWCCSAIVFQCYRSAVLLSSLCLDKQCIWVYELWVLHTDIQTYRHTEPLLEVLADLKMALKLFKNNFLGGMGFISWSVQQPLTAAGRTTSSQTSITTSITDSLSAIMEPVGSFKEVQSLRGCVFDLQF